MITEQSVLMILGLLFPNLQPFFLAGDSLYHALKGDINNIGGGISVDTSIHGKAYVVTLTPK